MSFSYPVTVKDCAGNLIENVLVVLERRSSREETDSGYTDVNGEVTLVSDYDEEHDVIVYSPDPEQNDIIIRASAI